MTLTRQFKGLLPALDRRQPTDRFVLTGQNFLVDAEGPYSAFGTQIITPAQIRNADQINTFRVGTESVIFTDKAVLKFNTISGIFFPVVTYASNNTEFPWSQAIVGGVHYFAKKDSGIKRYNPFTDEWSTLTLNVITTPYAVSKAGGRLVILGESDVQWSAIDDGSDLATDIEKGVGIQSLAIVGGGVSLAVLPTFDGFITYTSTGLMKSELVDSINPFRHFPLTADEGIIPLSQYSVIETANNEHVMLSKTGFYVTTGKVPQVFQPLMGEFFRRQILPKLDITKVSILRLTFEAERQWFIVSIAETEQNFRYTKAYVLYIPRDEWGLFNRSHVAFGELSITGETNKGFNFGYFCADGCMHNFVDFPQQEEHPNNVDADKLPTNFHYFTSDFTPPTRNSPTENIMTSYIQLETFDETVFTVNGTDLYEYTEIGSFPSPATPDDIQQDSTLTEFVFDLNAQSSLVELGWMQFTSIFGTIDAFIDVGLWRAQTEEDEPDEFTLINDVVIGMLEAPGISEFIDWLGFDPDVNEDWLNDNLDNEDWGVGIFTFTDYVATIIGSLDGYNQYQDQLEIMEERTDIVIAEEDETTGRARYFTCYNNGTYHIIRMEAFEIAESFHLKTIDIDPVPAGRV